MRGIARRARSAGDMATPAATLLLLCLIAHACHLVCGGCNSSQISAQVDALLAEYDREAAPDGCSVQLDLDVRHASVKERDSTVRMLVDLGLEWKDSRLAWNATEWGCETALTSAERLWLPDVYLINAVESIVGDPLRARITSEGVVSWYQRMELAAPLALRLDDWPKDQQTSVFKFASRAHTLDELNLTTTEYKRATVFEESAWQITALTSSIITWTSAEGPRRVITYSVQLGRSAPAHALAAAAVTAAAALLLVAAALLPPGERPPLCACAAFTTCLWMTSMAVRLPGGSGTPRSVSLMAGAGCCAALAAVCAALVQRLARCGAAPPQLVRRTVTAASGFCKLTPPEGTAGGECGVWAAAARLLDHALLAALALVLLVLLAVYA